MPTPARVWVEASESGDMSSLLSCADDSSSAHTEATPEGYELDTCIE